MDGTEKSTSTENAKPEAKARPPKKATKKAKTKATKEPKPRKEKAPKPELVVFALRMSREERDRIHRAGGPGGATRLVRAAAVAIADGNRAALDQLLTDVKTNLKQ
jgi:hypothetical protein